ncbi:hypothetical protein [Azoarcus sp. DN11]|uniref:hypothetical protein n=1 Tax=Azoarcus sp. DN11 TaxID=356837 RepID=UPI000EB3B745|nr:hypothetical protein [Azoarcus sp. DN11]AYH43288.1 hypothetical protein CDA09_07820 [Azoarcus sp. DN11]
MFNSIRKSLSEKYGPRFGQIAVELGFLTESQLTEALACQVRGELSGNGHRLLGAILFDMDILSAPQIDAVMTELFRRLRSEQATLHQFSHPRADYPQTGAG